MSGGAAAARRVFHYGGLGIGVTASVSHLAWLEEFLSPHFVVRQDSPARCEVTLSSDRRRYEEVRSLGPRTGELLGFGLDSRDVRLERWCSRSPGQMAFDERFRTFYAVDPGARRVTLLSPPDDHDSRVPLMRVVRELAMNHARRHAGPFLHAAGFALGDSGVAVAGPKRSGKTTFLVYALGALPARYVSNDRLLLLDTDQHPRVRGMPTIVSVRRSSLRFFPRVEGRLAEDGYPFYLRRCEARNGGPDADASGGPSRYLSPAQLCELLGADPVASVRLTSVVFPRITTGPGPLRMRRLNGSEAAGRLVGALFGIRSDPDRHASPLFDPQPPGLERASSTAERERALAACQRLASRASCYECSLGPEAYLDPRSPEILIRQLTEETP